MAVKTKGRVVIPRDIPGQLETAQSVFNKHKTDGAASPLNQLEDYSWDNVGPTIQQAREKHRLAEELKAKMEQAYEERDLLLPAITAITNASKGYLKAKYAKTPRRLGEWGFEVDDTPQDKAPKSTGQVG